MKILVVEDDDLKAECVAKFLETRNVEMHLENAVIPAILYASKHSNQISGIILDLGLTISGNPRDYECEGGMMLVERLTFDKINIPILINSSTEINLESVMAEYKTVKGQMYVEDDYETLGRFITFLETGGW